MKVALEAVHTAVEHRDPLTEVRDGNFSVCCRSGCSASHQAKADSENQSCPRGSKRLGRATLGGERVTEPCSRDIRASDTRTESKGGLPESEGRGSVTCPTVLEGACLAP